LPQEGTNLVVDSFLCFFAAFKLQANAFDHHDHSSTGDRSGLPAPQESVATRYLKYRRDLAKDALARLVDEETPDADVVAVNHDSEEEAVERSLNLNEQRFNTVLAALKGANARRVLDLGCGEGKLLRVLLQEQSFQEIVGVDVSHRALQLARESHSISSPEVLAAWCSPQ
jgi:SAM-dependent methyltransferase